MRHTALRSHDATLESHDAALIVLTAAIRSQDVAYPQGSELRPLNSTHDAVLKGCDTALRGGGAILRSH